MTMNFATFFDSAPGDQQITVSDGSIEPSNPNGLPHKMWRSHNFTGKLVDIEDSSPRRLRFELPKQGNAIISYTIVEGVGHNFEVQ